MSQWGLAPTKEPTDHFWMAGPKQARKVVKSHIVVPVIFRSVMVLGRLEMASFENKQPWIVSFRSKGGQSFEEAAERFSLLYSASNDLKLLGKYFTSSSYMSKSGWWYLTRVSGKI